MSRHEPRLPGPRARAAALSLDVGGMLAYALLRVRLFTLDELGALLDLSDHARLVDCQVRTGRRAPDPLWFSLRAVRGFIAHARHARDLRSHLAAVRVRHRALAQVVAALQEPPRPSAEPRRRRVQEDDWPEREHPGRLARRRLPLDRAALLARVATAVPGWHDPGPHVDELFSLAWYELREGRFTPRRGLERLAPDMLAGLLRLP